MKQSTEEPDERNYASLAPGDLFIDTTTTTLFQVMDYQQAGCTPSQIVEAFGITYDQVLSTLDYIEQHRTDVETAYLANSRTRAQQLIHKLVGSYRPRWPDRTIHLGGIGIGILFTIISIIIGRQSIASSLTRQDILTLLINALFILVCGFGGIIIIFFGIRLLIDSFSLQYTITKTSITATRYGGIAAYSIPVTSIIDAYPKGQFLYIICENGETYRILRLKQIREVANDIHTREADLQR